MNTPTPSLEALIENMDELYALADILDCKIDTPVSELKASLIHSLAESSSGRIPGIGGPGPIGILPTPFEMNPLLYLNIAIFGIGKKAVDITKNTIAKKKAEAALIPMYQEIIVKIQAENLQLKEDKRKLAKLLQETQQNDMENQRQIHDLTQKIESTEKIMAKFHAMFAAG